MMRLWLLILVLVLLTVPPVASGQGGDPTCDNGPNDVLNAAQVAFDAGDFVTALELAREAETLCASNIGRSVRATNLRHDAETLSSLTCDGGTQDIVTQARTAFENDNEARALALLELVEHICSDSARLETANVLASEIDAARAEVEAAATAQAEREAAELLAALPLAQPGDFGVGMTTLTFVDETRNGREVEMLVWYPADGGTPDAPVEDAAPNLASAPYPLVFWSHGFGSQASATGGFTENLASYGFVVVGIEHRDSNDPRNADPTNRPLDVLFALNQLAGLQDHALAGVMDTENVGVMGYSSGAVTTVQLAGAQIDAENWVACLEARQCIDNVLSLANWPDITAYRNQFTPLTEGELWPALSDPRIQAVMLMAPCNGPLFGERGLASVDVPIFIIASAIDSVCDYEQDAVFIFDHLAVPDLFFLTFETSGHDFGRVARFVPIIKHYVVAYFGYYLQGNVDNVEYFEAEFAGQFEDTVWGTVE